MTDINLFEILDFLNESEDGQIILEESICSIDDIEIGIINCLKRNKTFENNNRDIMIMINYLYIGPNPLITIT